MIKSKKSNLKGLYGLGVFLSMAFIAWGILAFLDIFWNFGTTWMGYIWLVSGGVIIFALLKSAIRKRTNEVNKKVEYNKNSKVSALNIFGLFISSLFIIWSIFAFLDLFWNFGTNWMGSVWLGLGGLILIGQLVSIIRKSTFIGD